MNRVYEVSFDNGTILGNFLVVAPDDLAAEERAKEFCSKLSGMERKYLTGLPGQFYCVNELHPVNGIIVR